MAGCQGLLAERKRHFVDHAGRAVPVHAGQGRTHDLKTLRAVIVESITAPNRNCTFVTGCTLFLWGRGGWNVLIVRDASIPYQTQH